MEVFLSQNEVSYSLEVANQLQQVPWAKQLLKDIKIREALEIKPDPNRTWEQARQIEASLFEIRFAHAIYKSGLSANYEFKTGIGHSSVDFKVETGKKKKKWLIELTSIASGRGDWKSNEFFGYCSVSEPGKNSSELLDVIKIQSALCNKVCQEKKGKIQPLKFPEPDNKNYHMILINVRNSIGGMIDEWDYHNICYGSSSLRDVYYNIYQRNWINENGTNLVKGIFDESHPESKYKYLRERIHAIGFINEKNYLDSEIIEGIKLFPNPGLFNNINDMKELKERFPLKVIQEIVLTNS